MESLSKAFVFSLSTRAWTALLSLAAMPLYLRYLGAEAFGVVGLFLSVQVIVGFFDFGLGATLTRQISISESRKDFSNSANQALTFEIAFLLLTTVVSIVLVVSTPLIATHWIQDSTIDKDALSKILVLASISIAALLPTTIYSAALIGLQRQTSLAIAQFCFISFRVGITILLLQWDNNLAVFFAAQIFCSLSQSWGTRWLLWRNLKLSQKEASVQFALLMHGAKFTAGTLGISLTTLLLTQIDKVILSRILTLSEFGVYVLCTTLANGIYVVIQPVFNLLFPRFSHLHEKNDEHSIVNLYRLASQAIAVLIIPITMLILFFSTETLLVWTGNKEISILAAPVLQLLIATNAINGLMNMPYVLQLSHGWTSLALRVNYVAIVILIPALIWTSTKLGAIGAALIGLVLQLSIIIFVPYLTHQRCLKQEKKYWYLYSVLIPIILSAVFMAIFKELLITQYSHIVLVFQMIVAWLLTTLCLAYLLPEIRKFIKNTMPSLTQVLRK